MTLERIKIVPEPVDVYQEFARHFLSELQEIQDSQKLLNLILPIGPTSQYPLIAAEINNQKLSMKNCRIILMDEYLDWHGRPLASNHHLSFRGQFEKFLSTLNPEFRIKDEYWVIPDPFDIHRIDNFISEYGPVQTCYGGIGVHGHVAFNEPPVSRYGSISLDEFRDCGTRVVPLAPETLTINALRNNHGKFSDFPTLAVTIGMKQILGARRIRLYADGGSRQHEALRQFAEESENIFYPITLLKNHKDVSIFVDRITGSELTK